MTVFYTNKEAPSVAPSAGSKSAVMPKGTLITTSNLAERSLDEVSVGSGSIDIPCQQAVGTTTLQSYYFGRFSSKPLAAQTITAQTWQYRHVVGESNGAANTMTWMVVYVYRPSNDSVVGFLTDAPAATGVEWYASPSEPNAVNLALPAITVQNGDILVWEAWGSGTPSMANTPGYLQTWRTNDQYCWLSVPQTIQFYTGPVGENTPSTADKLDFSPMQPSNTADITVRSSVASPFTHTPMATPNVTATITRKYTSVADPFTFSPMQPSDATAAVSKSYSSTATGTSYSATLSVLTEDIRQSFSTASPFAHTPMSAFAARADFSSSASPTTYSINVQSPTKDVVQGVSTADLFTHTELAVADATSSVQGFSTADSTTFATDAVDATSEKSAVAVGLESIASPATYTTTATTLTTSRAQWNSTASPTMFTVATVATPTKSTQQLNGTASPAMFTVATVATPTKSTQQLNSTGAPTSYAVTAAATPTKDIYQAYSTTTPISYALAPAPATAVAARVFISSADAAVFAPVVPYSASVNVASAASPTTFTLIASNAYTGQNQAVLSDANSTSYALAASALTAATITRRYASTADPASYSLTLGVATTSTVVRAYTSTATATSYSLTPSALTAGSVVRNYISSAGPALSYALTGTPATSTRAGFVTASATSYALNGYLTISFYESSTGDVIPAFYTFSTPPTTAVIRRVYSSDATSALYAFTTSVSTTSVANRAYTSSADSLLYSYAPIAATGNYVPYAGDVQPASYSFAPSAATKGTVQGFGTALPGTAYSSAAYASTTQRSYTSDAQQTTYNTLSAVGSTSTLNRVTIAAPSGYLLAPSVGTSVTVGTSSYAWPAFYEYTDLSTTVAVGRVTSSDASKASYSYGIGFTSDAVDSFGSAAYTTYSSTPAPATASIKLAPAAAQSNALEATYSCDTPLATVSIGRIYTSSALPTAYTIFTIEPIATQARSSHAVSTMYSSTVTLPRFEYKTIAFEYSYVYEPSSATVSLGRVYTSTATSTSYAVSPVDAGYNLSRTVAASPTTYAWTGIATTVSIRRVYVSVALETAYGHTLKDTSAGFILLIPSSATNAAFSTFVLEAFGFVGRSSIAAPFTFTGFAGAPAALTGFARVSPALPVEYVVATPSTVVYLGRVIEADALPPSAFKATGNFTRDAVNKNSIAAPTSYAVTVPVGTTSKPTKESLALPAGYSFYMPDTQSGRVIFSTASPPTPYLYSATAATSSVPTKYTSTASPPSAYATTATSTTTRYGYASFALKSTYGLYIYNITSGSSRPEAPVVYPTYTPKSAITEGQFSLWLEDERAIRVTLVETKCVDPVTGNTELVYFASTGFVTKNEDGPPVYYAPLMRGGLDFAQTLDLDLSGNQSYGDIELDNTTGELDWMFDRVWLYKEFKAYIGDATWPRRDFRQIFDGTVEDVDSSQRDTVNMRLRDKLYRLEVPLHETKIGGLTTNADRLEPVCMGECHNVTPYLSNATQLYYVYHTKAAEGPIEVRDNGIPISYVFIPGGPASFKLNKQPYGRITCSVQGDKTNIPVAAGGGYVNSVAPVIYRLMTEYGTEIPNRFTLADIDRDNFTAFDIANKAPIGLYQTERMTVLAACQTVAASVGARVTMNALGKAQLVRLQLPPSTEPANLCYNGNFRSGMDGWFYSGSNGPVPDGYVGFNLDPGGGWNLPGGYTFYTHQAGRYGDETRYYEYGGPPILVEPNKRYTVSALIGAHRAKCQVCFWEYDFAGTLLGSSPLANTSINDADPLYPGGNTVASYKKCYDSKVTSPTTHYIRVLLRKFDTKLGEPDSWLFATNVVVESETTAISAPILVTESDMVGGSLHIEDRLPIVAGVNLGYCKNWTVQEDTASGVPEEHKAMYAREWLTVAITDVSMRNKYNLWGEPEQENTLLLEKQSASTECQRRVNLRSTQRHVYSFVGFARLMFTPIGAAMTLKHPRFSLAAGKTGQVISVAVNWLTSQVTIKVLI